MHHLLSKLLKKRGIEKVTDLSQSEAEDFDRWNKVLSEGEVTVKKIEDFCRNQISFIETQWKNLDNSTQKNERLIALHTVYSSILSAIQAPLDSREKIERFLKELLDSP